MNQESMEELVGLVGRMREIVEGDPSMVWIGSMVSLLEAAVRDHVELRILLIYKDSRKLEAEG